MFASTVHLCKRLTDKKLVIIKQIPVEQMTKDQRLAALNEVIVLSMLNHPNIIQYYENFLEDKALMIVMEYAEGLFDFISFKCSCYEFVCYWFAEFLSSLLIRIFDKTYCICHMGSWIHLQSFLLFLVWI